MLIYDLTGPHPLLSPKAKAMLKNDEDQFNSQVEVAQTYLGLTTVMTGDQGDIVANFLALQVNWQIEIGLPPLYIKSQSSSHSAQSETYRDNVIIHPGVAAGLISVKRAFGFVPLVRSLRG